MPCYDAGSSAIDIKLLNIRDSLDRDDFVWEKAGGSAITANFNRLWCDALNSRKSLGITHFLWLHSDINPVQPGWFDLLQFEMDRTEADILSVHVPVKDGRGLVSTALDTDEWAPQRLTLRQVHRLPVTFTTPKLLINTGMCLIDLTRPWIDRGTITYRFRNENYCDANGFWRTRFKPEDWDFSRQARALGASIWVTRAVAVHHHGAGLWSSADEGGWDIDRQNVVATEELEVTDPLGRHWTFDPRSCVMMGEAYV